MQQQPQPVFIVIDMQNDFVTGVLGSPAAQGVVEPIRRRLQQLQEQGVPVLFTQDTHIAAEYAMPDQKKTQESQRLPAHCIEDTEGWQVVPALRPFAQNATLSKPTFLSTTLAEELRSRFGEPLAITLCGVCTDICVVSNALALRAEFPRAPITVEGALCAGTTPENHAAALAVLRSCLVDVVE